MNTAIFVGNLTRDPELKVTQSGISVTKLQVAVNNQYRDKQGQIQKDVVFIPVTVWGKQAESCNQYLKKGSQVLVDGRLKQENWEKDGQKRSRLVVVANRVQFLSRKQDGDLKTPTETTPLSEECNDEEVLF